MKIDNVIVRYRLLKVFCFITLFLCLLLVGYTTAFFKVEYVSGSSDAWWYEPEIGLAGKKLRPVLLMIVTLLLNALPFYQWKGTSWRLPIYDFHTRWIRRVYTPISLLHWIFYLLIIPLCIWSLYSPFNITTSQYASDVEMYGYHNDEAIVVYVLFFLSSAWILAHEIILLIKMLRNKIRNR